MEAKAERLEGLYIVATPVGNLGDISYRALEVLRGSDLIAAEDTRRTRVLLERYNIDNQLTAYHEHNAARALPGLIEKLSRGSSLALVSDAGTPGVSDPGYKLIREALDRQLPVTPIPGPSAVMLALVASGLPTDRFAFEGFLPKKKGRSTRLTELSLEPRTMVFFESPVRLARTLKDLAGALGEQRLAVVAREITKLHEQFVRGSLAELLAIYEEKPPRGEVTLVVEGAASAKKRDKQSGDQAGY